jgi:hypothetical protein
VAEFVSLGIPNQVLIRELNQLGLLIHDEAWRFEQ